MGTRLNRILTLTSGAFHLQVFFQLELTTASTHHQGSILRHFSFHCELLEMHSLLKLEREHAYYLSIDVASVASAARLP